MATLTDLFNPAGAEVTAKNTDLYKPSYKGGKNGVYKSIIRFVVNYQNPNRNIADKQTSYVKNPVTGQGMYVDDPRSINQPSPVSDAFFKLWNTKVAQYQDIAKKFLSGRQNYASLVQIIEYEQHPELKGQIKVFCYGQKLWDKIYAEEHPAIGQGINPFNPVYGRYFSLVVTAQGEYNNYDQSQFFDYKDASQNVLPTGLWYINPTTQRTEVVTQNTDQQVLLDYLSANSPDLSKYEFQPWTEDQSRFVSETIPVVLNYAANGGQMAQQFGAQTLNTPAPAPMGGLQVNATPTFVGATVPQPAAAPAAPVSPTPAPVPSFGSVSLGESSVPQAAPTVAGVTLPNVTPAVAPAPAAGAPSGLNINIDDIVAGL